MQGRLAKILVKAVRFLASACCLQVVAATCSGPSDCPPYQPKCQSGKCVCNYDAVTGSDPCPVAGRYECDNTTGRATSGTCTCIQSTDCTRCPVAPFRWAPDPLWVPAPRTLAPCARDYGQRIPPPGTCATYDPYYNFQFVHIYPDGTVLPGKTKTVLSLAQCQLYCSATENCTAFSYAKNIAGGKCTLMAAKEYPPFEPDQDPFYAAYKLEPRTSQSTTYDGAYGFYAGFCSACPNGGLKNAAGTVCCEPSCTQCGGTGCSGKCCASAIVATKKFCSAASGLPCIVPEPVTTNSCNLQLPFNGSAGVLSAQGTYCCPSNQCNGVCGGSACSSAPGGAAVCCTSNIKKSNACCGYFTNPSCINCNAISSTCNNGYLNSDKSVCCPASCGQCGGINCQNLPGGEFNCCTGKIKTSGKLCKAYAPPCIMG